MRGTLWTLLPCIALATLGIDLDGVVSTTTASCFKGKGMSFASVRAWHSYGAADTAAPGTIANLWNAGIQDVDVYMFPCAGQDATTQVNGLVDFLQKNSVKYGMVWFDIETNPSPGCGWGGAAQSCTYMSSLIAAIQARGVHYGIYSSEYMWSSLMGGNACKAGGDHPLWYAHYDGNPSFSDFTPFGGWTKPSIKQYAGTTSLCGYDVDSDWYPSAEFRNVTAYEGF